MQQLLWEWMTLNGEQQQHSSTQAGDRAPVQQPYAYCKQARGIAVWRSHQSSSVYSNNTCSASGGHNHCSQASAGLSGNKLEKRPSCQTCMVQPHLSWVSACRRQHVHQLTHKILAGCRQGTPQQDSSSRGHTHFNAHQPTRNTKLFAALWMSTAASGPWLAACSCAQPCEAPLI
jgi:hypothetical protein